jgi:hypothetical protein
MNAHRGQSAGTSRTIATGSRTTGSQPFHGGMLMIGAAEGIATVAMNA